MAGLTTVGKEIVQSMSNHTRHSGDQRTFNEFLNHYVNGDRQNRQRLEALQDHNETQWSADGVVIIDDTDSHKINTENSDAGGFYDHADDDYVWDQNFVFTQYADDTTTYPLVFRRYGNNDETKPELAMALVDETLKVGVPANTYLFDTQYCNREFVDHVESYDRRWLSTLERDDTVEYGGEEISIDTLAERIDTIERKVGNNSYKIWTKKLSVSKLGAKKVLIAEKEIENNDKKNSNNYIDEYPAKYIVTNMIDAPAAYLLRTYSMSKRIETFIDDTEQTAEGN